MRYIEINENPPVPGGGAPANRYSFAILGLIVSDFDDVLKRLSAAGGTVVSDSPEHPPTVARCAFARDPEGRLLEIVQLL